MTRRIEASQVCILVLLICLQSNLGEGATDDNKAEFQLLCKFYKVTQNPPLYSPQDYTIKDVISNLELLNMTTSPDEWYNLFAGKTGEDDKWSSVKDKPPFKGKLDENPEWQRKYDHWSELKKKLLEAGTAEQRIERPPNAPTLPERNAKIRKALETAFEIERKLVTTKSEISVAVEEIKVGLGEVLAGKGAQNGTVTGNSFVTNNGRATSCQSTADAGKSLANDITCLCVGTSASEDPCGADVGAAAAQWQDAASGDGKAAYEKIIPKCGTRALGVTTANVTIIHHLLTEFTALLGAGAASGNHAAYVLGTSSNQECAGGNGAICVSYKKVLHGAAATGILWLQRLQAVGHQLEALERKKLVAEKLLQQAHSLDEFAGLEYAGALGATPFPRGQSGSQQHKPQVNNTEKNIEAPTAQTSQQSKSMKKTLSTFIALALL